MAQFTIYRSTDASAPVLTGEVGSLVALLTACLVNGYGAKATAGWTLSYTGTNKAVYRPGAGSQHYLHVADAGGSTGGAKEAQIRGYEAMSAIDTGTGPFPSDAQCVLYLNHLVCRKSATASNVARPWLIIADSRTCYILIQTGDTASTYYGAAFGDIYSYAGADAYQTCIIGRYAENVTGYTVCEAFGGLSTVLGTAFPGHFLARGYTQSGGSLAVGKHGDGIKQASAVGFSGSVPFTNGPDGGIYLAPVIIHETSGNIRGQMRGLYVWLHTVAGIADADTFSGSGDYATKTFLAVNQIAGNVATTSLGVLIVETSDTLLTN